MMLGLPTSGLKGLGITAADNVPGQNNACGMTYLSYLFNPSCWTDSFADWQAAYNAQSLLTTVVGSGPGSGAANTGTDPCTAAIGISCPVLAIGAVLGIFLISKL